MHSIKLLCTKHSHGNKHTLLSQIAMESGPPHSMPPLFAHKDQRKDRQRHGEIDKGKGDPGILEADLGAQFHRVEADAEAKDLTAKVEQGADFGCLLSVTL